MKAKPFWKTLFFLFMFCLLSRLPAYGEEYSYLWSSCTTHFQTGIDGREKNIEVAARILDGYQFLPGVEFSFNETVTRIIPEEELGMAACLVGDKRVPGLGGGLCQVASTLYDAALIAGISIRERKAHSSVVGYITPGLDATVSSDDGVDLKIQNPYRQPLLVRTSIEKQNLTISLFGLQPKKGQVKLLVSRDEEPNNYISTFTRRVVVNNGKEIFSEIVSRDRYRLPTKE
jgi:vancomycin resistance protein YoaR